MRGSTPRTLEIAAAVATHGSAAAAARVLGITPQSVADALRRADPATAPRRPRRGALTGRTQHAIAIAPADWRLLEALATLRGGSRADALERVFAGYRAHVGTLAPGETEVLQEKSTTP